MANIHKPTENCGADTAATIQTLNNGANTPTYLSLANYDLIWFLILTGTRTGAASITAQMRQRIGAAGTEANLKTSATLTAGDTLTKSLWARGEDLTVNSSYDRAGILLTETASQNFVVCAIAVRMRARFKQATMPT